MVIIFHECSLNNSYTPKITNFNHIFFQNFETSKEYLDFNITSLISSLFKNLFSSISMCFNSEKGTGQSAMWH